MIQMAPRLPPPPFACNHRTCCPPRVFPNRDMRLCVDFGKASLVDTRCENLVSETEWPKRQKEDDAKVYAAGGWRIGDRVLSTVDDEAFCLKKGDAGTVCGPYDPGADDDSENEHANVHLVQERPVIFFLGGYSNKLKNPLIPVRYCSLVFTELMHHDYAGWELF